MVIYIARSLGLFFRLDFFLCNRIYASIRVFFSSVPVPLAYLSKREVECKCKFALFLVVPVRVLEKLILKNALLIICFPLSLSLLVLNLFMVNLFQSGLRSQGISHLLWRGLSLWCDRNWLLLVRYSWLNHTGDKLMILIDHLILSIDLIKLIAHERWYGN